MTRTSVLVIAFLVSGCAADRGTPAPTILAARAPTTAPTCTIRGALPDPNCTPGDVETTDLAVICGQSTKERRNVPASVHRQVFAEYGIAYPEPAGSYEVDHYVPIELGGSNDLKNIWPEAAEPEPGFHQKDAVENSLHRNVCAGEMTIQDAQRVIAEDWRKAMGQ